MSIFGERHSMPCWLDQLCCQLVQLSFEGHARRMRCGYGRLFPSDKANDKDQVPTLDVQLITCCVRTTRHRQVFFGSHGWIMLSLQRPCYLTGSCVSNPGFF